MLNELIDSKGLAIEKIDQLVSEYSKSKVFVNLDNFESSVNSIQKLLDNNDFGSVSVIQNLKRFFQMHSESPSLISTYHKDLLHKNGTNHFTD